MKMRNTEPAIDTLLAKHYGFTQEEKRLHHQLSPKVPHGSRAGFRVQRRMTGGGSDFFL